MARALILEAEVFSTLQRTQCRNESKVMLKLFLAFVGRALHMRKKRMDHILIHTGALKNMMKHDPFLARNGVRRFVSRSLQPPRSWWRVSCTPPHLSSLLESLEHTAIDRHLLFSVTDWPKRREGVAPLLGLA